MTMPASSIGISTCPNGTCSSIARTVANTTSGSLCALSVNAGKTAPHSMLEFAGYENFSISQSSVSFSSAGQSCNIVVYGSNAMSYSGSRSDTWFSFSLPEVPSPSGVNQGITVSQNTGGARSGTLTLTPAFGAARTVSISQAAGATQHSVYISDICADNVGTCGYELASVVDGKQSGECYYMSFGWGLCTGGCKLQGAMVQVVCNGVLKMCCRISLINLNCSGSYSNMLVCYGDTVCMCACATATYPGGWSSSNLYISNLSNVSGCFVLSSPNSVNAYAGMVP